MPRAATRGNLNGHLFSKVQQSSRVQRPGQSEPGARVQECRGNSSIKGHGPAKSGIENLSRNAFPISIRTIGPRSRFALRPGSPAIRKPSLLRSILLSRTVSFSLLRLLPFPPSLKNQRRGDRPRGWKGGSASSPAGETGIATVRDRDRNGLSARGAIFFPAIRHLAALNGGISVGSPLAITIGETNYPPSPRFSLALCEEMDA